MVGTHGPGPMARDSGVRHPRDHLAERRACPEGGGNRSGDAVGAVNPCSGCRVDCCVGLTVFLSAFDLARLRDHLPDRWREVVGFLPAARAAPAFQPYAFSLGGRGRFLLTLRRSRGACVFLLPGRAAAGAPRPILPGRCRIHVARPDVCRCYPFAVREGRLRMIPQSRCPQPWTAPALPGAGFPAAWEAYRRNFFQYQAFLETWHEEVLPRLLRDSAGSERKQAGWPPGSRLRPAPASTSGDSEIPLTTTGVEVPASGSAAHGAGDRWSAALGRRRAFLDFLTERVVVVAGEAQ